MATATGIWNHAAMSGQALPTANPMANSTGSADSSSSSDSATISANDFLTLLVTEMQNQDPTANTDPNEYINQLVNVNSLEQLISINQNLSTALGSSATSSEAKTVAGPVTGATGSAASTSTAGANTKTHAIAAQSEGAGTSATSIRTARNAAAQYAPGNLGVPKANPAAERVAQSLSGKPHVP
jgi:flagellar basal-body rod modification protein FlgD